MAHETHESAGSSTVRVDKMGQSLANVISVVTAAVLMPPAALGAVFSLGGVLLLCILVRKVLQRRRDDESVCGMFRQQPSIATALLIAIVAVSGVAFLVKQQSTDVVETHQSTAALERLANREPDLRGYDLTEYPKYLTHDCIISLKSRPLMNENGGTWSGFDPAAAGAAGHLGSTLKYYHQNGSPTFCERQYRHQDFKCKVSRDRTHAVAVSYTESMLKGGPWLKIRYEVWRFVNISEDASGWRIQELRGSLDETEAYETYAALVNQLNK